MTLIKVICWVLSLGGYGEDNGIIKYKNKTATKLT